MVKRSVGNRYSYELFEDPDFSELCNHNGKCEYLNCRFRHYGDNPRNALMEELHKKIALKAKKRKKKKAKKTRQRQKRSNKKKNLKREEQRDQTPKLHQSFRYYSASSFPA